MLVYDGLHYDALAVEAFLQAPEEIDITLVGVCDPLAGKPFTCHASTGEFTNIPPIVLGFHSSSPAC